MGQRGFITEREEPFGDEMSRKTVMPGTVFMDAHVRNLIMGKDLV
jgi:hypothetical protein